MPLVIAGSRSMYVEFVCFSLNCHHAVSISQFTLGSGQVIAAWDKTFATMKKGEHATIISKPE
jgi:hypothetical protein